MTRFVMKEAAVKAFRNVSVDLDTVLGSTPPVRIVTFLAVTQYVLRQTSHRHLWINLKTKKTLIYCLDQIT